MVPPGLRQSPAAEEISRSSSKRFKNYAFFVRNIIIDLLECKRPVGAIIGNRAAARVGSGASPPAPYCNSVGFPVR